MLAGAGTRKGEPRLQRDHNRVGPRGLPRERRPPGWPGWRWLRGAGEAGRRAREEEEDGRLPPPRLPASSRRARRRRPLASLSLSRSAGVQAGLGGPGGARGRAPLPHFSSLPPPPGAVPGGRANERREEGSGKRSAPGRGPPTARGAAAPTPSLHPGSLRASRPPGLVARCPRGRRPRVPGAAAREHSGWRPASGVARAGAGTAASRRCRMAAEPPSSLSYRTTGSTCLHPLSELLGIPLDQVTAGGLAAPGARGAGTLVPSHCGRAGRGAHLSHNTPPPNLPSRFYSYTHSTGGRFF